MRTISAILVMLAMIAAPVSAKPALRDVAAIDDALFDVGVADIIRKKCSTISARKFKAITFVLGLERKARDMGYSKAEIDAYIDSDVEKNRMRAKAATFFAQRGVDPSDPESYCGVGLTEIQMNSRIGSLLKAK